MHFIVKTIFVLHVYYALILFINNISFKNLFINDTNFKLPKDKIKN